MKGYTTSWLKVEEGFGGARPVLKGSAEEMRAQFNNLGSTLAPLYPRPSDAIRTDRGSLDTLKYTIYTPVGSRNGKALPVGMYYHPGGFVLGPSDCDDSFCRAIAEKTGSIVVSVQYRLSPEYKAPAHLQDAVKGFEWAYQKAAELGGDSTRMYTMGASAGAGLAISVARQVALGRSAADPKAVKGIVALCPFAFHPDNIPPAYKSTHSSFEENNANVPMIDGTSVRQFWGLAALHPDDEDYFPVLDQGHHKHFPPTYIVTCEFDPLRDDGKVLAQCLAEAGACVKTNHYGGLPHCFWVFPSVPEAEVFMKEATEGVAWVIDQM